MHRLWSPTPKTNRLGENYDFHPQYDPHPNMLTSHRSSPVFIAKQYFRAFHAKSVKFIQIQLTCHECVMCAFHHFMTTVKWCPIYAIMKINITFFWLVTKRFGKRWLQWLTQELTGSFWGMHTPTRADGVILSDADSHKSWRGHFEGCIVILKVYTMLKIAIYLISNC